MKKKMINEFTALLVHDHHFRLRALRGLHFWCISLVLALLLATSHVKALTLGEALDF